MSNKFLSGGSSNLEDGTANLYIANMTMSGLDASMPMKTDASKTIISTKLDISDTLGLQTALDAALTNPMTADLGLGTNAIENAAHLELNKLASTANATAGTLRLYANSDNTLHVIDDAGNDIPVDGSNPFDQDLNTTDAVEFKSVLVSDASDWTLEAAGSELTIDSGTSNSLYKFSDVAKTSLRATNVAAGVGDITSRIRGTLLAPLAILDNDVIDARTAVSFDGVGSSDASSITTLAAQNWSVGNHGAEIVIDTTDVGAAVKSTKLTIGDSVALGSGGTNYTFPTARGIDGDILVSDSSGVLDWLQSINSRTQSTGVLTGGELIVNADPTLFDIADGTGEYINTTTGVVTQLSWSGLTDQSLPFTGPATHVSLTPSLVVVGQTTPPNSSDTRDNIYLGLLGHPDTINIQELSSRPMLIISSTNQLRDLAIALGPINTSGNVLSSTGALTFQKTLGAVFAYGSNYATDIKDPHNSITPAKDTSGSDTFIYVYRNGMPQLGVVSSIIPGEYDDGSGQGSPGTVANNDWSSQRVYLFPTSNTMAIQPGQMVYNTLAEAQSKLLTESFVTPTNITDAAVLIGYIIVRGSASDLSSAGDALFVLAAKFSGGSAGVAMGDVVGPIFADDNGFARFDGTSGKSIKDSSGATLSDTGGAVFTEMIVTAGDVGTTIISAGASDRLRADNGNAGVVSRFFRAQGDLDTPTVILNGTSISETTYNGYDGTSYVAGAYQTVKADGNWSGINRGTKIITRLVPSGTTLVDFLTLSGQGMTLGEPGSDTVYPAIRGTDGQSLQIDSSGFLDWVDPADVFGPAMATNEGFARFDGTTGKLLQDSPGATLSDTGESEFLTLRVNTDPDTDFLIASRTLTRTFNETSSSRTRTTYRRSGGSAASPTDITSNAFFTEDLYMGWVSGAYVSGACYGVKALGSWTGTNQGTEILMGITPSNTTTIVDDFIRINGNGLGIGATGTDYTLPPARGTDGQILKSDGSGILGWTPEAEVASGTAADPSYTFVADTNTGMYLDGPDSIGFSTGGAQRVVIEDSKLILDDSVALQIGSTSAIAAKPITDLCQANGAIAIGQVVKIVNNGGARVAVITSGDAANTSVYGVAVTASAALDDDILIATGGKFVAMVQNGETIAIGATLKKSAADSGRVTAGTPGLGSFAIAMTSGTGNAGGTVTIICAFKKESS